MNVRWAVVVAAGMAVLGRGQTARSDALAALDIYAGAERRRAAPPYRARGRLGDPGRRTPATLGVRGLLFPIPSGARLSSPWGPRRNPFSASGMIHWHSGVDLAARSGTVIVATHSGRLTTRYSRGSGLIVRVSSPHVVTEYRHLKSFLRNDGPVRAGEPIGRVGSTGRFSTGPHLHYSLWVGGRQVNPAAYFSRFIRRT